MTLKGWCAQNSEQSNTPRTTIRGIQFQVTPELPGGNADVSGGKISGNLSLSNLTPELAAEFANGAEVDIVVTVRQPA